MRSYKDDAISTLVADITAGQTNLAVQPGHGLLFPITTDGNHFYARLQNGSIRETVKVVTRAVDGFTTIVRAQEGTTASAFPAGSKVYCGWTAAGFELAQRPLIARQPILILPGSTGLTVLGTTGVSLVGTVSTYQPVAGTLAQEHKAALITSAGTANNNGSGFNVQNDALVIARGSVARHGGFLYFARFIVATGAAGNRLVAGITTQATGFAGGAVEPSETGDMIVVAKDSSDTDIAIFTRDNANTTKTPLTIPRLYTDLIERILDVEIEIQPGPITFMHVRVAEWNGDVYTELHNGVVSSTLPRAGVALRSVLGIGQGTDTASAKTMRFCRMYLETPSPF